jgi:hypothetical protein
LLLSIIHNWVLISGRNKNKNYKKSHLLFAKGKWVFEVSGMGFLRFLDLGF